MATLNIASASKHSDGHAQKLLQEEDIFRVPDLTTLSRLDLDFETYGSATTSNNLLKVLLDPKTPIYIVREISGKVIRPLGTGL